MIAVVRSDPVEAAAARAAVATAGIVAGWSLALLGLSDYARRWIGPGRWRSLHRPALLAWGLWIAHSLGEGTDAGEAWFLVMTAVALAPALVLLARTGELTGPTRSLSAARLTPGLAPAHSQRLLSIDRDG